MGYKRWKLPETFSSILSSQGAEIVIVGIRVRVGIGGMREKEVCTPEEGEIMRAIGVVSYVEAVVGDDRKVGRAAARQGGAPGGSDGAEAGLIGA